MMSRSAHHSGECIIPNAGDKPGLEKAMHKDKLKRGCINEVNASPLQLCFVAQLGGFRQERFERRRAARTVKVLAVRPARRISS
jgi:hypothetical protein